MKKKMIIEVPNGWNDVTLKKYLALHADMDNYKDLFLLMVLNMDLNLTYLISLMVLMQISHNTMQ